MEDQNILGFHFRIKMPCFSLTSPSGYFSPFWKKQQKLCPDRVTLLTSILLNLLVFGKWDHPISIGSPHPTCLKHFTIKAEEARSSVLTFLWLWQ